MHITGALYLALIAWEDKKTGRIPLALPVVFGVIGGIDKGMQIGSGEEALMALSAGLVPGCLLLLICLIGKEQAGAGDGICALTGGLLFSAEAWWKIFCGSLLLSAFWSAGILLFRKGDRKTKIPFLVFPFFSFALLAVGGLFYG